MYEAYGVPSEGAVVVVRPDGYVALMVSLEDVAAVENYFRNFLTC